MAIRKNKYGWLVLGGLVCLFGVVMVCRMRDNVVSAQDDTTTPTPVMPAAPAPAPLPTLALPAPDNPVVPPPSTEKFATPIPAPMLPMVVEPIKPPPSDGSATTTPPPLIVAPAVGIEKHERGVKPPEPPVPLVQGIPPQAILNVERQPVIQAGDTYQSLARKFYGSENYAAALEQHNRTHEDASPDLRDGRLKPGDRIYIPIDKTLLETRYPDKMATSPEGPPPLPVGRYSRTPPTTPMTEPTPISPISVIPTTQGPPPAPIAASTPSIPASPVTRTEFRTEGEPPLAPRPGLVQVYHVKHDGETPRDIARKTLGSTDRAEDVIKLNPSFKPDTILHEGTVVRLPSDACLPTDEVESVKPLPILRKPAQAKVRSLPLTGTFPCNLDEKHGVALPRAIRDQLGNCDTVLVSPGPDQCLWVTNQAHLDRLSERLDQSPAREIEVRVFKRLYFAQTERVPVSDGRVQISERLALFAGLNGEVVLVGIDDHFELWDVNRWKAYTQQQSQLIRRIEESE
jgi:MraZ protein